MGLARAAAAIGAVLLLASPAAGQGTGDATAPADTSPAVVAALAGVNPPLDINNLPPWPRDRFPPEGMPSRLDRAPPGDVVAAVEAGNLEGHLVLVRRMRATDPAMLTWAREESAKGKAAAFVVLARIHVEADNPTAADLAEGARAYRAAANLGDAMAMRELGVLYEEGRGVERNEEEAVRWWKRAAQAGESGAMMHLAHAYRTGAGAPKDLALAKQWDEKLEAIAPNRPNDGGQLAPAVNIEALTAQARAGDLDAMYALGVAYARGHTVDADPGQAFVWFSKGAENGDPASMNGLGQLYRTGAGVEQDTAKAMEWLRKAADAGSRAAMFHLYEAYELGKGVKADQAQAKAWLYRWFWAPDLP